MRRYRLPKSYVKLVSYLQDGDRISVLMWCAQCGKHITVRTRPELSRKYVGWLMAYGHTLQPGRYAPVR